MDLSISRGGIEIGQWTDEEVRVLYDEGRLVATDLYWTVGMSTWESLASFVKPPPPFPLEERAQKNEVPSTTVITQPAKAAGLGGWLGLIGSLVLMGLCSQLPQIFPTSPLSLYGGAAGLAIGFYFYFNAKLKDASRSHNYLLWNGAAIGIVAGLLISAALYYFSITRVLKMGSDSINMSLPKQMNSISRIDRTSVTPNNIFVYHVSLLTSYIPTKGYEENMKEQLLDVYRKDPEYRRYLDEGVRFEMDFFGPDGVFLTSVSVGPEDAR